jgi:hypothetical protein
MFDCIHYHEIYRYTDQMAIIIIKLPIVIGILVDWGIVYTEQQADYTGNNGEKIGK